MRFIYCLVFIQIDAYADLLQKFTPVSSALKHDETPSLAYDIDEMVCSIQFFFHEFFIE